MNRTIAPALAATILAATISGCGRGAEANNTAEEAAVKEAPPAAPAEAPVAPASAEPGGAPTAAYMTGKWSALDESCADTLEFRNDGKVTTPIGDANWSLAGDKLTLDYGEGSKPTTTTIKVLTQDRIEVTTASGRSETQKRC